MSGVLVGRPVILVAVVIGALGGTPAWASRDSHAGSAPPTLTGLAASAADVRFVPADAATVRALMRVAQSRIAVSDAATEGDEVPNPAFMKKGRAAAASRPADMGGDEVPSVAAVNPAMPDAPVTTPQPASASGGGDEVPNSGPMPGMRPGTTDSGEAAPGPVATPSVAPAPPVAPVAAPAAPVDPVAEQLRELAAGKFDRLWGGDKDKRAALDAFYSKRNYAPIWISDGKANDRASAAIEYLAHVDADGLNPADYVVPDVASMTDPASLAEGEIKLSAAVENTIDFDDVRLRR
jgi:L,D-transpeptidase YcbB